MTFTVTITNTAAPENPSPIVGNAMVQERSYSSASAQIILPLPPSLPDLAAGKDTRFEMEIYARFMRHLRSVPNSRMDIRILSSIRFTADMLEVGEDLVSKILVDLGLRAPRRAFPCSFLDFCDKCLIQADVKIDSGDPAFMPGSIEGLKDHWDSIKNNRLTPLPVQYASGHQGHQNHKGAID